MIFTFRRNILKLLSVKFEYIELSYILISYAIFHLFEINYTIKGFLALPAFLIIPHLIGKATFNTLSHLTSTHLDLDRDIISEFILNWCAGIVTLVTIAYFLNYINLFDAKIYAFLIIGLTIIGSTRNREISSSLRDTLTYKNNGGLFWGRSYNFRNKYITIDNKAIYICSILFGFVAFLFVTTYSPYPYAQGGDSLTHNYVAIKLIRDNFFHFQVPYLISLSLLASSILQIFNINESYVLWWAARLLLYVTYSLGLCLFSYQISKKRSIALLVPIIGIFVTHATTGLIFLSDLAPKTLILILFPYVIFITDKYLPFKRNNPTNNMVVDGFKSDDFKHIRNLLVSLTILISIFFAILHYTFNQTNMIALVDTIGIVLPVFLFFAFFVTRYIYYKMHFMILLLIMVTMLIIHTTMGFVASILIISYFAISILLETHEKIAYAITYIASFMSYSLFILQKKNIINFNEPVIEIYEVASQINDVFQNVISTLDNLYPHFTLYFFFIGCLILIFTYDRKHIPLLFLTSICFAILFSPIRLTERLFVYLNPLIAYFAACCIILFYNQFKDKRHHKQIVYVMLVSIVLMVSIIGNSTTEIDKVVSTKGYFSHAISKDVVSISNAISNKTNEKTIILSYRSMPIHRYIATLSTRSFNYQYRDPPQTVKNIFEAGDAESTYNLIKMLSRNTDVETKSYLSGVSIEQYEQRVERCEIEFEKKKNYDLIIFLTKRDLDSMHTHNVSKYYNKTYFTVLYEDTNKENYIFGVNPIIQNHVVAID